MDQPGEVLTGRAGRRHGPCDIDEYYRLAEQGYFRDPHKVELIEGELVWVNSVGSLHMSVMLRLNGVLSHGVGDRALVSVKNPVRLDRWNEPGPDVALLEPRPDHYRDAHPSAGEVLLLIEVADTSLAYDSGFKKGLYAFFGVQEYWIVDIGGERVEVCRRPTLDGYADVRDARAGDALTIAALPGLTIPVRDVLG